MHLRSAAGAAHTYCAAQQPQQKQGHGGAPLDLTPSMAAIAHAPGVAKGTTATKKLLLWLVVLLQIFFICCFWLLQLDFNASVSSGAVFTKGAVGPSPAGVIEGAEAKTAIRVNFIKKIATSEFEVRELEKKQKPYAKASNIYLIDMVSNFAKDFYLKPTTRLNRTMEDRMLIEEDVRVEEERVASFNFEIGTQQPLWCFREGSINQTSLQSERAEDYLFLSADFEQCKCKTGWHGSDCGQPEIIWRALMKAQRPLMQWDPSQHAAHRLVYMLEGNLLSLDLLELQIQTVVKVVDIFLIYVRNAKAGLKELKALKHSLRYLLSRGNYLIYHCSAAWKRNCTTAQVYARFRQQLQQTYALKLKPTDLFLYSDDGALISPMALSFLKYYAAEMQLVRFRLKYVVYGFYWQHPVQTHLTGVISSFRQLNDPLLGNADPAQLLRHNHALIIGDLNHFGGWYCMYCQQPEEIIAELQLHAESSSSSHVHFPNATRNRHVDVAYLQKLIGTGIFVDGKKQLTRLRQNADKYYAPLYTQENSWKFGHLLVNLYESLGETADEEEEQSIY